MERHDGRHAHMALPAALGVLAEAVVFFLPAWALTLPIGRQLLAWALFAFISIFALTNSLRVASGIAADSGDGSGGPAD
jgi:MFS superfamily sulfate permease-like transporter